MATSVLETDGYKLSMAEAGWPLRDETFHCVHRKGGPQRLPVEVASFIRARLPQVTADDLAWTLSHGYGAGPGFEAAVRAHGKLRIDALPKGAWFLPGEPLFSVSGPSALVSWLEPLLLQLHFRIQVATWGHLQPERLATAMARPTCEEERRIVIETLEGEGLPVPPMQVDEVGYRARVRDAAARLVAAVGSPTRIFEVGMRAASCPGQHRIALEAAKEAGFTRTSDVLLARELDLVPVGTMGHEHVQRYRSDAAAFRAMRDRRPERSSYLLDTFDTLRSGLPAALDLIAEQPDRGDSVRFDSGDKAVQLEAAEREAKRRGLKPTYILEDGLSDASVRELERVRVALGIDPMRVHYGVGGWLVNGGMEGRPTRDAVSAVYKLSRTGPWPVMKFGNEAGRAKESHPGEPVVWRRIAGDGAAGIVGQRGEPVAKGYALLTGSSDAALGARIEGQVVRSEATEALARTLRHEAFGSAT